jgi:hypothetical protein
MQLTSLQLNHTKIIIPKQVCILLDSPPHNTVEKHRLHTGIMWNYLHDLSHKQISHTYLKQFCSLVVAVMSLLSASTQPAPPLHHITLYYIKPKVKQNAHMATIFLS